MHRSIKSSSKGVTLIELTVVISVLLLLVSGTVLSVTAYSNWQTGLDAGESIKKVYTAQKLYLAENPTKPVSGLTADDVIKFMPDGSTALPVIKGLGDETLSIDIQQSPPIFTNGATPYDPSGSTTDNLWDTGK